jgi:molybdenum cofactor cytidylyltransferase
MRLGILLLVAGGSSRMGTQKLLLPWGESTVVGGALEAALAAGAAQVIIVTGCDAARVEEACRSVCVSRTVQFVFNPDWASGMLSSIRAGLGALDPTLDGFFVALGDMGGGERRCLRVSAPGRDLTGGA